MVDTPIVVETSRWTKMALLKACKAFGVHTTGFESDIMGLILRMEEKRKIQLQQQANTEAESKKGKSKGVQSFKKLPWGLQEGSSNGKKERSRSQKIHPK